MRHLRILGLALTAAFALAAIGTATASAALPEVLQCAKAKKEGKTYLGHYSGKKCEASTYHAEGGQKYELEPWNAAGKGGQSKVKKFTGKSGIAFLEIYHVGPVTCKKGADTGEFTGPKTVGNVNVTFTGCELDKASCSSGVTAGEIKTKTLKGTIGYFDEEFKKPVAKAVGIDLSAQEAGGYLAEFSCALALFRVSDSVIGEVKAPYNVFTKEVKLHFSQADGEQGIQSFEGEAKDTLCTETLGADEWHACHTESEPHAGESGQSGEAENKGEELELKA